MRGAALMLGLALLLGGCADWNLPQIPGLGGASPEPTPAATLAPTSVPAAPATAAPTRMPQNDSPVLTLWLPPELDPNEDSEAGGLLRAQLAAFVEANPEVQVEIRVKALDGPGGLIESLSAASAAAPGAMPALIALPRTGLETAALKGLIYPLDDLSTVLDEDDWYPYARQLGQIQGTTFGLPIGGDALALVYRPSRMGTAPATWEALLGLGHPVAFVAADPQSYFTLNLYMMLGGRAEDEQRRPALQPEVLAEALKLYSDGAQQGIFPYSLSQVQTDRQAWQAYEDQLGQWLVTWSSIYLRNIPPESTLAALPTLEGKSLSLATGWVWAVSEPDEERRATSARLAEFLSDPAFLAEWDAALGLLPTRPSVLKQWQSASLKPALEEIITTAQVRPANDVMAGLAPALEAATLQVIKRESDAAEAARAAAERLAIPINK